MDRAAEGGILVPRRVFWGAAEAAATLHRPMGLYVAVVLFGLVLLRWGVGLFLVALILRPVSDCPACLRPTVRIRRPWLQRLAPWIQWRWCPHCGWEGPAKKPERKRRIRSGPEPRKADRRSGKDVGKAAS